jgi:GNAT superfamily N-acetyltransferase
MEFYMVTVDEPDKFIFMAKKILADAQQYSFNYINIKMFTTVICFQAIQDSMQSTELASHHYYVFNRKGWAIIYEMPDFVEVKYIFVYPEYRRNGFFTQLLTLLKLKKKQISICTCESIMLRALIAKGFQLERHSLCGTELLYILPFVE